MTSVAFRFELLHDDASSVRAAAHASHAARRRSRLPAFMPVGTQGTVKGVDAGRLRETGAQMILANTYHLPLRPGEQTRRRARRPARVHGLGRPDPHRQRRLPGLQPRRAHDDRRAGRACSARTSTARCVELTPERAVADSGSSSAATSPWCSTTSSRCPTTREVVADAMRRSVRWAERCRAAATRADQALFAIVQGGLDAELRAESAEQLVAIDFPGYAIGGLERRRDARGDVRGARRHGAPAAARPAALPDGRRPADRSARSDRAAASTCSTA